MCATLPVLQPDARSPLGVPSLESIDWLDRTSMRRVCERLDVPDPSPADVEVHVVFDVACDHDPLEELQRVDSLPDDARVAVDSAGRAALWRYREALNETISALGVPHKLDVSVPVGRTGEFARRLRALVRSDFPRAEVLLFGHLADGNVHVNLLGLDPAADDVDEAVLRLVADCRGSISAEHGVGVAKRRWLHLTRTPGEIAAMRAVKRALDPNGILNPGRLLPD